MRPGYRERGKDRAVALQQNPFSLARTPLVSVSRMRFTVIYAGTPIGSANLEEIDASMGIAAGAFEPAPDYERVRHVFRKYADAHRDDGSIDQALLDRMYQELEVLNLRVVGPDGADLAVEWVMIYDFGEEAGADGYRVDVCRATPDGFDAYWPTSSVDE
jgi:hypothetical protein